MTQQESQQNLYAFAEMEYMLNSYFQKNIKGIVDSSYKYMKDKQSEEYYQVANNRAVAPGMSGIMNASLAAQEVRRSGTWNTKHTEDLVGMVQNKIFKDGSATQHDIGQLVVEWKKIAINRIGRSEYDRISKEIGCDLASYYISHRIDDLTVQRIAKLGAPKSSLNYILKTGVKESFVGFVAELPAKGVTSEYDDRVEHLQEESFGEGAKFAGRALGFAIDMVTPGMKMKGIWAAIDIGVRTHVYSKMDGRWKDYNSFEKDLGKAMFGNEKAMGMLRSSQLGINNKSDGVQILNSEMKKKVFSSSVDMDKVKVVYRAVEKSVNGDAEKMVNMVHENLSDHNIKVKTSPKVAGWMYEKDVNWLIRNSAYYTAMALDMKSKGISSKKIGNKVWSLNEIAQRGYDYSVAGYQKQLIQVKNEVAKAEDVVLEEQGQSPQSQAQAHQTSYVQTDHGQLQVGNSMRNQSQDNNVSSSQSTQTPSQNDDDVSRKVNPSALTGWGDLFNTLGLGGFGEIGKNFGYVLSMLPDMLINMFTGKSRNLKFGDNLMSISAIIMGMFIKNPFLKMLFMGLGGANLLKKAGQEALENRDGVRSQTPRQYYQYDDEELDSRIKNPGIKGNSLVATIDGVPCVITIKSADAIDAYYKGVLPLNTLANAVLCKYDEQQQSIQENYSREVSIEESTERSYGLK